jgi:tryptophanyl-tRNA synthetase
MSLRDGTKKMSKSDPSALSRITLTDSPEAIAKKIQKAKTDPKHLPNNISELENRPEAKNLINIYAALTDISVLTAIEELQDMPFTSFKSKLTDLAVNILSPISIEINKLLADPKYIDDTLTLGADRARNIAVPIVTRAYDIVGLLSSTK